jgi:cyclophilin family peptidyl-prolyl cis-trans isomerase
MQQPASNYSQFFILPGGRQVLNSSPRSMRVRAGQLSSGIYHTVYKTVILPIRKNDFVEIVSNDIIIGMNLINAR